MISPDGLLNMSTVNTEIGGGRVWNSRISLGDSDVRNLAGRPSGSVSMGDLRGKSSYIPMTLYGVSDYSSGQVYGNTSTTASCYPTVTVYNGIGPFTYSWAFVSGSLSMTGADTARPRIYNSFKYSFSAEVELQVTVRDSTGRTATIRGIYATFEWYPEGQDPR